MLEKKFKSLQNRVHSLWQSTPLKLNLRSTLSQVYKAVSYFLRCFKQHRLIFEKRIEHCCRCCFSLSCHCCSMLFPCCCSMLFHVVATVVATVEPCYFLCFCRYLACISSLFQSQQFDLTLEDFFILLKLCIKIISLSKN